MIRKAEAQNEACEGCQNNKNGLLFWRGGLCVKEGSGQRSGSLLHRKDGRVIQDDGEKAKLLSLFCIYFFPQREGGPPFQLQKVKPGAS